MSIEVPLTLSIKDAVRVSSIGRTKLHELIKSGDLKVTRIGRRTLVNAASLRSLLDA